MVKLTHINPDTDATYHLRLYNKDGAVIERLAWCHPRNPILDGAAEGAKVEHKGRIYAVEHDVSADDAAKLAGAVRGKNLAVVETKKKKD